MRKLLISIIAIVYWLKGYSQVSIGGHPYGIDDPMIRNSIAQITTPSINQNALRVEDSLDLLSRKPPRFGSPFLVNYNLMNSGTWKTLSNGNKIWQLRIICPTAKSINFIFNQFHLPSGATLYIYNPQTGRSIGGFTSANNKGTFNSPKKMATGLMYGNSVILELHGFSNLQSSAKLEIGSIIHGYRLIRYNQFYLKNFQDSKECQVNINCSEGANAQDYKRGVAMIIVNGNRVCTGSLVTNTQSNKEPYFLTAHHCLLGKDALNNPEADDWSFVWEYEAPDCTNPNNEPILKVTNGATVLANNDFEDLGSDFALLKLKENPKNISVYTYFNGWDRTLTPAAGGFTIHHPEGDIKKISTHTNTPTWTNISPAPGKQVSVWQVKYVQTANGWGITESGSSGSPLFQAQTGRIIGQLYGGPEFQCNGNQGVASDLYGMFRSSWNGFPSTTAPIKRRLRDFLDPISANQMFMNGLNDCHRIREDNRTISSNTNAQACSIFSRNLVISSSTTWFRYQREVVFDGDFEVKNGADFEIIQW